MCPSSSRTDPDRPGDGGGAEARLAELSHNLTRVRERIAAACRRHDRDAAEVTLVAVTKTFPAADALRLVRLGVTDLGENRDQEAVGKAAEVAARLAELPAGAGPGAHPVVRWHFIGRLQRNKARSVARYAEMVHSVDSVRLAETLAADAVGRERPLTALVQVSLDGDPARGGAVVGQVPAVAEAVAAASSLRLGGLMAVAPLSWHPARAYEQLAAVSARLRADHPAATVISAGMSGDLDIALGQGATHLRIGSALLGNRASLR